MLSMLPKLALVVERMYFCVLTKVVRPCRMPALMTSRSCISSTMSAASRATSTAPSTEMPTSAACNAGRIVDAVTEVSHHVAQLAQRQDDALLPGSDRPSANTSVCSARCHSASSRSCRISAPVRICGAARPTASATWRAVCRLSPVTIFSCTPSERICAMLAATPGFTGFPRTAAVPRTPWRFPRPRGGDRCGWPRRARAVLHWRTGPAAPSAHHGWRGPRGSMPSGCRMLLQDVDDGGDRALGDGLASLLPRAAAPRCSCACA